MTIFIVSGGLVAFILWITWNCYCIERWELFACSCGCWSTTFSIRWVPAAFLWRWPLIQRVEALHVERALLRL